MFSVHYYKGKLPTGFEFKKRFVRWKKGVVRDVELTPLPYRHDNSLKSRRENFEESCMMECLGLGSLVAPCRAFAVMQAEVINQTFGYVICLFFADTLAAIDNYDSPSLSTDELYGDSYDFIKSDAGPDELYVDYFELIENCKCIVSVNK